MVGGNIDLQSDHVLCVVRDRNHNKRRLETNPLMRFVSYRFQHIYFYYVHLNQNLSRLYEEYQCNIHFLRYCNVIRLSIVWANKLDIGKLQLTF